MTASQALGSAGNPLNKLTYPSLMQHNTLEVDDGDEPIMMKGHDGMVRPLKDKLRTLCKQRRIRLQEFFKPYDVHHNKKVSKGQFRRALDQAGLTAPARGAPPSDLLTVQEVEVLVKRYEVKGDARAGAIGEGVVNYWKLCEQVEKVFTRRGLEKNPTLDVKLSLEDRPGSGYGVHRPGLSTQEADQVATLLGRVRLFSATEGLIVKSLFETFDKRHSGRVTSPIFLRQLDSMFKGRLSKEEARLLLRAYQTRDGSVSYRAMHADCDDASGSAPSGIGPVAADAGATDVVPVQQQQQQQQQHRQGHCTQLQKQRLAPTEGAGTADGTTACLSPDGEISQGSVEADAEDFDDGSSINSSVTGFPTRGAVGFMVGEEQGSGSPVSGRGIAAGCGVGWRRARGRTDGTGTAPPPKDSLPIERKMASKVVYHRLIPEDAYAPYDPTRSGSVTESVFRRGLSDAFRLPFSDDQLDTLTRRYRHGENKVSFLNLCEHVYAIADNTVVGFGRQHQHQYPQQHEREQQQQQRQEGGVVEESARERETIDKALEEIRATLRRRRLSIQPGFQEFDRKNEGHVSVGQLARVLCSFGVLPADHHTQELLSKRYAATDDPRHPTGVFIAYRHLLEDLGEGARGSPGGCLAVGHHEGRGGGSRFKGNDGGGGTCNGDGDREDGCGGGSSSVGGGGGGSSSGCCGTSVAASRVFGKPTGLSRPAHSVVSEVNMTSSVVLGRGRDRGLAELLAQLKAFTFRSRLRTLEFFRCDDAMRSGSMSREKFGRNLLSTGFRVSPLELETLCEAYVDPNVSDKGGAPFVRYVRLVEEIEGVFGVRELERKPECDVDASVKAAQASFSPNPAAGSPSPKTCSLSAEEEEVVMETLRELGAAIHRRRLSLTPPLRDFDRFNRGVVPGAMFDRVLSSVGLLPARPKARLLQRKFAERFSSPDSRSDVNYMAFLEEVETAVAGHDKIPDGFLIRAHASTGHRHPPGSGSTDASDTNGASSKNDVSGVGDTGGSVDRASVGGGRPLSLVVKEVARQLAVGWANIADFLNDADRLKQGEITLPKLKVALALAGVLLTNEELHILEHGFRSDRSGDMVDWRRLAVAVNKVGGPPVATSWNGEVFDPSVAAGNNHRRSQHNHHQPRGHQAEGDSAPVPHLASGVPSPNTTPSPPLSPLSSPSPLGSSSSPAQQGQQEHRRATCDGSSSATAVTNRMAARHQDAVMYRNMGNGSSGGDGGGVGAGWNRRPVMGGGGGGSGVGPGNDIGDAVDVEVLNKSLDAVRHRVKHYRMHLKPSFQDFDPNRKMKITRQQFLSVLGNMNLNLTEREQDTICCRYTVHERSPGARVQYAVFCEDVDPEHARAQVAMGAAY